ICAASIRSTLLALSSGKSFFSAAAQARVEKAAQLAGVAFAQNLGAHNSLRQVIDLYTHSAGIETGYGFFAPNVPDNYKLVFELSYNDGSTETVLPTVANDATGIRLVDLLDRIEPIDYPDLP